MINLYSVLEFTKRLIKSQNSELLLMLSKQDTVLYSLTIKKEKEREKDYLQNFKSRAQGIKTLDTNLVT